MDAGDLIRSHLQVTDYYASYNDRRDTQFDFVIGQHWTKDEQTVLSSKKKTGVVFNQVKASERTVLGLFIQNRYDVKFAPREQSDQDVSDVLQQLYSYLDGQQEWSFKDIELFRQAWAGGNAFQEVYVDVMPGREPQIKTRNQNPYAIYWDPDSRDLMNREDAEFVDRVTWMTFEEFLAKFPDKVSAGDIDFAGSRRANQDSFEKTDIYKDQSHLNFDEKNGRVKVIERFYKARKKVHYTLDQELRRQDIDPKMARFMPGQEVFSEEEEMLHLAIVCPAWRNGEYLFNDEYHCQPRDPGTQKIIFPILEFVAESLNGQPSGFVEHLIGPNKVINSTMSNILHATKHQASTSLIRRPNAFLNENEDKKFDKHHSDGDRVFVANGKAQDLGSLVTPVPKGEVSRDNYSGLELALNHFREVSSTPPALQGQTESSSVSGVLNAQRVEQAFVQLQVLIANWKHYLKRRARLIHYYIREYWTYEKTFRIIEKKSPDDPSHLTINQMQPQVDYMGRMTGGIEKINDVSVAEYDIVIEDSHKSPSYRYKTQQQISELMQTQAVQSDPVLLGMLFLEYSRLSDMSQELKDFIKQYSSTQQQQVMMQQQAAAQQQQLDQMGQMQQLAQSEAEQTTPPPQPQSGQMGARMPQPGQPMAAFNYPRAKTSFSQQQVPA